LNRGITEDSGETPLNDLIAQDFHNLSPHDRNAINEEMHGVSSLSPEETPEMVADAIHRLSLEIDAIETKPAYDRSQQWNSTSLTMGIDCTQSIYNYNIDTLSAGTHSTYVNTLDFRLRFLRADLFDAKKAATRLVKFLEMVMELYDGDEELLRRPIGLNDLKSKEEKDYLKLGNHQLLPFRDRSGRRVIAMVPDMAKVPSVRMRVRTEISIIHCKGSHESRNFPIPTRLTHCQPVDFFHLFFVHDICQHQRSKNSARRYH
jgi:hypothetical protein